MFFSHRTINGHTFKTRAYKGTISNSRFYDGELGGASCQLEMPNGGSYLITNCIFHKGPQPQNPNSIQFCAEMSIPATAADLTIMDSTFINNCPTGFPTNGIYGYGGTLVSNGVYVTITSTDNSFIGYANGTQEVMNYVGPDFGPGNIPTTTGVSDGRPCVVDSHGTNHTSSQPPLDFTPPTGLSQDMVRRPDYVDYDGEGRNNWVNSFDFALDPGTDDLRFVVASTPPSTVLFTPTILPSTYSASAPGYVNPFSIRCNQLDHCSRCWPIYWWDTMVLLLLDDTVSIVLVLYQL